MVSSLNRYFQVLGTDRIGSSRSLSSSLVITSTAHTFKILPKMSLFNLEQRGRDLPVCF